MLDADAPGTSSVKTKAGGGGGGFKKGGFKSSFATVKGPVAPVRKNVLGDDEEEEKEEGEEGDRVIGSGQGERQRAGREVGSGPGKGSLVGRSEEVKEDAESDTDEEYARDRDGGGYYDPRRPTGCYAGCAGVTEAKAAS